MVVRRSSDIRSQTMCRLECGRRELILRDQGAGTMRASMLSVVEKWSGPGMVKKVQKHCLHIYSGDSGEKSAKPPRLP